MSDMTETVRKLLDKAQATDFPEEAEAFFAKAQELITLHGLSQDAIAAAGNVQSDEVTHRDFRFEAPYSAGKLLIAVQIASVFRLKCVRTESGANNVLCAFGTKSKLDDFEMLLTAVNMHATGELLKARPPARENARSFRAAFLQGYASTIGRILADADAAARTAADESFTVEERKGVALVQLSEKARVDEAFTAKFPRTRTTRSSGARSHTGRAAGAAAGERFTGHQNGIGGQRKALSR